MYIGMKKKYLGQLTKTLSQISVYMYVGSQLVVLHKHLYTLCTAIFPNLHAYYIQKGDTPLHDAARVGHVSIIITLLKNGANIDTKNYVCWCYKLITFKFLVLSLVQLTQQVQHSLGSVATSQYYCTMQDRQTPLMIAASNGHLPVAHILIEQGANVNIMDSVSYET